MMNYFNKKKNKISNEEEIQDSRKIRYAQNRIQFHNKGFVPVIGPLLQIFHENKD